LPTRSGTTNSAWVESLPSESSISGKDRFSRISKSRSAGATISSTIRMMVWPIVSRAPQRLIEAAQSTPRTGVPSWNSRPSRSRKRQTRPSSETSCDATICGFGRNRVSTPNRVSYTMKP
jgi:hypothetical protein